MFLWCDIAVAVQSIIPTFLSILARLSAGFVPFLFCVVNPQFPLITMVKFVMEKKKNSKLWKILMSYMTPTKANL